MSEPTYGDMIRQARQARGRDQQWLALKVKRKVSTVARWEASVGVPPIEQINLLVANLPLSTEELLRAMGLRLTPTEAERLPRQLVERLLEMTPEQLQGLLAFLGPASAQSA